jgi:hypothetical protein
MKFILAMSDKWMGIALEIFNSKEELLKYLNENEWELIQTIDWNNLEKYNDTVAEYVAVKSEHIGRTTEAYLRVVKTN